MILHHLLRRKRTLFTIGSHWVTRIFIGYPMSAVDAFTDFLKTIGEVEVVIVPGQWKTKRSKEMPWMVPLSSIVRQSKALRLR